jgi:hypothetical protein
MGCAIL